MKKIIFVAIHHNQFFDFLKITFIYQNWFLHVWHFVVIHHVKHWLFGAILLNYPTTLNHIVRLDLKRHVIKKCKKLWMHTRHGTISYVVWNKPIPSKNIVSLARQATISLSGNGIFQGMFQSIIGFQNTHFSFQWC